MGHPDDPTFGISSTNETGHYSEIFRTGPMGPWAHGPWARGPWAHGSWARGPCIPVARVPVGPWPLGPWALGMDQAGLMAQGKGQFSQVRGV